jgi:hypothetical protein
MLIIAQLVKKFPIFYGSPKFMIEFTTATGPYPEPDEYHLTLLTYFFKIHLNAVNPQC